MDIEKTWSRALKNTEIIRARVSALMTGADTRVPYILLSESAINIGDTIVRKGTVTVEKPAIIVPPHNPIFEGFEFEEEKLDENTLINFLLVRGVRLPSMRYDNQTSSLNVFEGKLSQAIKDHEAILQREENVSTGLIAGPEDCWQFSLLIFICSQIMKNADMDIRHLLKDIYRRKND